MEALRSYVLELEDDIGGESCTPETLDKADRILEMIKNDHEFIKAHEGYLWEDRNMTKEQLLEKYSKLRKKVIAFQL